MNCEEARNLIDGYADGELDLRTSLAVEQHLKECPLCAREHEGRVVLRAALKDKLPYYEASATLRERVRSSTGAAIRAEPDRDHAWDLCQRHGVGRWQSRRHFFWPSLVAA